MKAESLRTTHLGTTWYQWYLEPFTHWIIIQVPPKLCFSLLNFIYIVTLAKYLQVVDFNFSFILHCILWKKLYEWYSKFKEFSKIIEVLNLSSKDFFTHVYQVSHCWRFNSLCCKRKKLSHREFGWGAWNLMINVGIWKKKSTQFYEFLIFSRQVENMSAFLSGLQSGEM